MWTRTVTHLQGGIC